MAAQVSRGFANRTAADEGHDGNSRLRTPRQALQHGLIPTGLNVLRLDPAMQIDYVLENREQPLTRVLSNSFGFGGTNCSLIFGRADHLS